MIDGVWHEYEPVGEEKSLDLTIGFKPDAPASFVRAALTLSPDEAYLNHAEHLAYHKIMTGGDKGRAVLFNDYVEALKQFPEFIVYLVCKTYWLGDPRPVDEQRFMPSLLELQKACRLVWEAFERAKSPDAPQIAPKPRPASPEPTYRDLSRDKWGDREWAAYLSDAEGMVEVAKKSNGALRPEIWEEEAAKRMIEYREREKAMALKST